MTLTATHKRLAALLEKEAAEQDMSDEEEEEEEEEHQENIPDLYSCYSCYSCHFFHCFAYCEPKLKLHKNTDMWASIFRLYPYAQIFS